MPRIDGGRRHHHIEIKDPGSEDEAHTPDRLEVQPLEGGTELRVWVPSKQEPPTEPEVEELAELTEVSPEQEAPPQESKADEDSARRGRLRNRKRRALKVAYDQQISHTTPDQCHPMNPWGPMGPHRGLLLDTQRDIEDLLTENGDVSLLTDMVATLDVKGIGSGKENHHRANLSTVKTPQDKYEVERDKWLRTNCATCMSAAKQNRPNCLRWALDEGADIDAKTKAGSTLLHLAPRPRAQFAVPHALFRYRVAAGYPVSVGGLKPVKLFHY